MKKLLFSAAIFFSFLISSSTMQIFAQENTNDPMMSPASGDAALTTTPVITMENKEIQYDLPYPGILPDNPLYIFKIVRDRVQEFFITDPMKKAVFDLSQADKRVNSSTYLDEEKPVKDSLISSTVSKALNYYEKAISATQQAQKQGEDVQSFVGHMDTAGQKYHQIMLQLQTNASDSLKADLDGDEQRVDSLRGTVVKMEAR